ERRELPKARSALDRADQLPRRDITAARRAKFEALSAQVPRVPSDKPTLASLRFDREAVVGGELCLATIALKGPAPSAGALVHLESGSPLVTIPKGIIRLEPGQSTATFRVVAREVSERASVAIKATYEGSSRTATLTLLPHKELPGKQDRPAPLPG